MTLDEIKAWTGFGTMIGVIVVAVMNQLSERRRKLEAEEARVRAEEAKRKADEALVLNKATHTLVNSNMGAQLLLTVVALDRVYEMSKGTPNEASAKAAAVEARRLYDDHVRKQALVDANLPPKQLNKEEP